MKKLVLMFAFLVGITFISCNRGNVTTNTSVVDSTEVVTDSIDSLEIDSLEIDSIL